MDLTLVAGHRYAYAVVVQRLTITYVLNLLFQYHQGVGSDEIGALPKQKK